MNEKDLKDNLNKLRADADKKRKEIYEILTEVRTHQKEITTLRKNRDQGNEQCKTLSQEAKKMRENRDELNQKIAKLKDKRKKINEKIKSMSGAIKDNKEKRDELNRSARGTDEALKVRYEKDIDALLNQDIPLEKEKKIYASIFTLIERLQAAKEATNFHQKVITAYDGIKELDTKADKLSAEIRAFADESEKYHLKAVGIYAQVDETRKQADESHEKLLEHYKIVSPMRDRISEIKVELDKLNEEMSPYLGDMDKIRTEKEHEKRVKLAAEAKEKLKSSKRISFDDLKAIMDGNPDEDLVGDIGGDTSSENQDTTG